MLTLWRMLRAHPLGAGFFAGAWLLVWTLTLVTWQYNEAGLSFGMNGPVFALHFALPLAIGALAVRWCASLTAAMTSGASGSLAYCGLDFALLLAWGGVLGLLGRLAAPEPGMGGFWGAVGEGAGMGFLYLLVGLVLSAIGGLAALLVRSAWRGLKR